jgi:hypothetical protein
MRSCSKVSVNGSSPAVAGGSFSSGVYQLGDGEGRQFQRRHVLGNKRFTYLALVVCAQSAANFHYNLGWLCAQFAGGENSGGNDYATGGAEQDQC